ncbi:MAG: ABC-2 transporter permease [Coriobacteriales bacterium]|nr:ABC-2 transporter permease [Coriobacteriales bacterium]
MRNLLIKELTLSASMLSYLFITFGSMFFLPGYPILCGAFFACLGIFQSFQRAREANDLVFSALLPVAKKDVARGKVYFSCIIELCTLLLMAAAMLVRMTILADSPVYRSNVLMNANPFALGVAFVIFGLFNLVFIAGFFRTSYQFGKPFVAFVVVTFTTIMVAEAAHHIPGLEALNAFGFDHLPLQLGLLVAGAACYIILTTLALRSAAASFERTDL